MPSHLNGSVREDRSRNTPASFCQEKNILTKETPGTPFPFIYPPQKECLSISPIPNFEYTPQKPRGQHLNQSIPRYAPSCETRTPVQTTVASPTETGQEDAAVPGSNGTVLMATPADVHSKTYANQGVPPEEETNIAAGDSPSSIRNGLADEKENIPPSLFYNTKEDKNRPFHDGLTLTGNRMTFSHWRRGNSYRNGGKRKFLGVRETPRRRGVPRPTIKPKMASKPKNPKPKLPKKSKQPRGKRKQLQCTEEHQECMEVDSDDPIVPVPPELKKSLRLLSDILDRELMHFS